LCEDPSERRRLGNLGRAYACQFLDKEVILDNLIIFLTTDNWNLATRPLDIMKFDPNFSQADLKQDKAPII
jgi:hypothetical protein